MLAILAGNPLNLGLKAEQTAVATGLPLAGILASKETAPARNGSNH